jgi:hypothetical protein
MARKATRKVAKKLRRPHGIDLGWRRPPWIGDARRKRSALQLRRRPLHQGASHRAITVEPSQGGSTLQVRRSLLEPFHHPRRMAPPSRSSRICCGAGE